MIISQEVPQNPNPNTRNLTNSAEYLRARHLRPASARPAQRLRAQLKPGDVAGPRPVKWRCDPAEAKIAALHPDSPAKIQQVRCRNPGPALPDGVRPPSVRRGKRRLAQRNQAGPETRRRIPGRPLGPAEQQRVLVQPLDSTIAVLTETFLPGLFCKTLDNRFIMYSIPSPKSQFPLTTSDSA